MSTLEVKMDGIPGVACLFVLPMGKERCRGGVKEVGVIRDRPGNRRPKTRQQNSSCPEASFQGKMNFVVWNKWVPDIRHSLNRWLSMMANPGTASRHLYIQ